MGNGGDQQWNVLVMAGLGGADRWRVETLGSVGTVGAGEGWELGALSVSVMGGA